MGQEMSVTDLKEGEGATRKTSKSALPDDLEALISAANPVAGVFVMQKGRLRHVNHALAAFLGYSNAQQVIDKSLWKLIHPDDRKQVRIGRRRSQTAIHHGRKYFRVVRQDGSVRWVEIQGQVLFLEGRPAFVGCMVDRGDTSEQQAYEREYRRRYAYEGIVGKSKAMQDIYRLVEDLAALENAVLISGESGTGKKLIAKALHSRGRRAFEPFVSVNCAFSDEKLLESELFGCVKSAFAGADRDKQGQFECADGGTLLLDEIGDVSPRIQLKLLRVLQEKEFERMGDNLPRRVNVRVLASTRNDLRQKVKKGEFSQALYDRLAIAVITPPPLRERSEDIPLLAEHFRKIFNQKFGRNFEGVASEALGLLMDYPWPGNVCEFEQAMEHAFGLFDERLVVAEHLPVELQQHKMAEPKEASMANFDMEEGLNEILGALNKTFWNKSKAAKVLGMSRQTLYRKMHEFGLL